MVPEEKILLAGTSFVRAFLHPVTVPLIFLIILASCGNDIKTVNAITLKGSGPAMSAQNIEVLFSDSGRIEARLTSPVLNKYEGPEPYLEFPKGFRVIMYDTSGRVESTISGNYGKQLENTRIMLAKGNVVVRNELKNQQINTEELTWNENKNLIYSDVKVMVTTSNKVLFSDGLRANDAFTWYEFTNPHGQMTVKQDSI